MIVDEPTDNVRFVPVVKSNIVALFPVSVHVPLPMVRVRVFELEEEKAPQVTLKLLALNVPWVRVSVLADAPSIFKESASVTLPVVEIVIGLLC